MATAETARRNPGGRPAIGPQIAIAFPPDMLARVDDAALAAGISRSEWVRRAVAARLGWCPTVPPPAAGVSPDV